MTGFLLDFTNGSRISYCAKRVLSEVENLSSAQGARLALMTALFRREMLSDEVPGSFATIRDVVQHPTAYRKEICFTAFCLLEEIREAKREKIRSYASFKVLPSPDIVRHTEICDLALSLLMSTIGVGYKPSTLQAVRYSWERTTSHYPVASDIALIMNMPPHILMEIMEEPIEPDEWVQMARSRPEFLNKAA